MRPFLIALQFLTILPVKIRSEIKPKEFGKSLLYFPIVGMLVGILLAVVAFLSDSFLPPVKAIFILIISIFISGGMHLDGFADTCDGFCGARTKEEILRIMRDSRIGVMGTIGITCLLLLKFTLIADIPKVIVGKSLVMMSAFSRWSQVLTCYSSKYARQDGKAKFFIEHAGLKEVVLSGLFSLVLFWLLAGLRGLGLFLLNFAFVFLCLNYIKKRIGGMTGDTIGALSEVAEISILLLTLFIWNH